MPAINQNQKYMNLEMLWGHLHVDSKCVFIVKAVTNLSNTSWQKIHQIVLT